jgi:hypothetical protein
MDSENDHDPLTTTALLATAEVNELLEGIRLSFQTDDAEFAEMTPNVLDSTCTPCNWRAASLALKTERHPYPNPGRKRKLPLPSQARQQPKRPHLPTSATSPEKSAEPEKVIKKARSTSLGVQAATTTMVTSSANEKNSLCICTANTNTQKRQQPEH